MEIQFNRMDTATSADIIDYPNGRSTALYETEV